jgi:hypothetical protein
MKDVTPEALIHEAIAHWADNPADYLVACLVLELRRQTDYLAQLAEHAAKQYLAERMESRR